MIEYILSHSTKTHIIHLPREVTEISEAEAVGSYLLGRKGKKIN